jgi:hypothetical protein
MEEFLTVEKTPQAGSETLRAPSYDKSGVSGRG